MSAPKEDLRRNGYTLGTCGGKPFVARDHPPAIWPFSTPEEAYEKWLQTPGSWGELLWA